MSLHEAATTANVVQGNYIGTNAAGTGALANAFAGVAIFGGAQGNVVGGTAAGARNVISGNADRGITISDAGTNGNLVQGNFIGTNAAGTAAVGNGSGGRGIDIFGGAQSSTIGGGAGARNVISGNLGAGVSLNGSGTNLNRVEGNTIGLNATASVALANGTGVQIFGGAQANTVGGTALGVSNLISSNSGRGVEFFDATTTGNAIRGNSIYGNTTTGIALFNGANGSQAAPVLTGAVLGSGTMVQGTLTSAASATFRIEFFANSPGRARGGIFSAGST